MNTTHVTFAGGAGSVTGANFWLKTGILNILVDCGMEQGSKMADFTNWEPFIFDPSEIDILVITHAHIDHIGRIPKLIHEGFKGRIISTHATKAIAEIMLRDTANILSRSETGRQFNLEAMYSDRNLEKTQQLWDTHDYHEDFDLGDNITCLFKDAGHVLGSAMVELTRNGKKFVLTGDLGNSPSPILRDTEEVTDANYMLIESVYGDRNHEERDERTAKLKKVIHDNYKKGGVLVIPIFSLERTQELILEINNLAEAGEIPKMPLFVDSPLAIRVTDVFRRFTRDFKKEVRDQIAAGDDIFAFPGLEETLKTDESKAILRAPSPKIILAGGGMSTGGRVLHHEKHYLGDKNSTILIVGYQTPGTLGRQIFEGAKKVIIFDEEVHVRANVETISGYSGHKDSDHLLEFVHGSHKTLKKVFVAMGEMRSATTLAQKIRDNVGVDAKVPMLGETALIDF